MGMSRSYTRGEGVAGGGAPAPPPLSKRCSGRGRAGPGGFQGGEPPWNISDSFCFIVASLRTAGQP